MFWDELREISVLSIGVRVVMALAVGGLLGLERGKKNRPAGLRTYMLVCLGATMVMATNQYVSTIYEAADPVRMGAQVVSGIGFLGAGTIIVTGRHQVKGMTTAAGMWTSACCGLAIGIGFYEGALMCAAAIWVVMVVLRRFDDVLHRYSSRVEAYVEFDAARPLSESLSYLRGQNLDVLDIQMLRTSISLDVGVCVILTLESRIKHSRGDMVGILESAPGARFVEEL